MKINIALILILLMFEFSIVNSKSLNEELISNEIFSSRKSNKKSKNLMRSKTNKSPLLNTNTNTKTNTDISNMNRFLGKKSKNIQSRITENAEISESLKAKSKSNSTELSTAKSKLTMKTRTNSTNIASRENSKMTSETNFTMNTESNLTMLSGTNLTMTTITNSTMKSRTNSTAKTSTNTEELTLTNSKSKAKTTTNSTAKSKTTTNSTSKTKAKTNSLSKSKTILKNSNKIPSPSNSNWDNKVAAQKHAFPSPVVNPLTNSQLKATKQIPINRLSNAFSELNFNEKVKRQNFLDLIKYTYFKLTKAEANIIFNTIDTDRDDLISPNEYHDFSVLYLMPFEACDTSKENLLSIKDFKLCFSKDPKRQQVTFRRRHEEKNEVEEMIMNILSTRGRAAMNIFEYIIFRRALYSWIKCESSSKFMVKAGFNCGINTFISHKYLRKTDTNVMYDIGILYSQGANLIDLDFISYLRIAYYTLAFLNFNQSNPTMNIEKNKFLKAVHEDVFPNNFKEEEILLMYSMTSNLDSMDFSSFSFYFHFHRLFDKYSFRTPFKLTEIEFLKLIEDNEFPLDIRLSIDRSFVKFTQPEYLEASLILSRQRLNEFGFYKFKQDATVEQRSVNDKKTINANAIATLPYKTARKFFFTIMSKKVNEENIWDKDCFYRSFLYSNLYHKILSYSNGYKDNKTFMTHLIKAYETSIPSVHYSLRANINLYKNLPDEIKLDLLLFLEINNCLRKMGIKSYSDIEEVNEVDMKMMMKDFGMELMPDTVLDIGFKGKDNLGRRVFTAIESFKSLIIVQAAAAENHRSKRDIKVNKLIKNNDLSRKFPEDGRRFEASPLV